MARSRCNARSSVYDQRRWLPRPSVTSFTSSTPMASYPASRRKFRRSWRSPKSQHARSASPRRTATRSAIAPPPLVSADALCFSKALKAPTSPSPSTSSAAGGASRRPVGVPRRADHQRTHGGDEQQDQDDEPPGIRVPGPRVLQAEDPGDPREPIRADRISRDGRIAGRRALPPDEPFSWGGFGDSEGRLCQPRGCGWSAGTADPMGASKNNFPVPIE